MDDVKPTLLANKIILQMVRHMVSEQVPVTGRDYSAIRIVFRQCGGRWERIMDGDQVHLELLKTVTTAWGQLPETQAASDRLI